MATVAEGWLLRSFALAEGDLLLFFYRELHRFEACILVGTIAKGLLSGVAAGTPPVAAGFKFLDGGLGICNASFVHGCFLSKWGKSGVAKLGVWHQNRGIRRPCQTAALRRHQTGLPG